MQHPWGNDDLFGNSEKKNLLKMPGYVPEYNSKMDIRELGSINVSIVKCNTNK